MSGTDGSQGAVDAARAATLMTILEAVPAAIWYKDTHNRLLAVNGHAAQLEGLPPAALAGKTCWELYPAEQAAAYFADDQEVMRSGQPKLGIIEPHSTVASGELRWLEVSKVPVRGADGAIIGVVAMAVDVTEKRRLEDALRNSQRLESLSVLAGGLAHDYNNLFAAVFGFMELARESADCGPKAAASLRQAGEAIGRARALTRQLVTFARGGNPALTPVELSEVVTAAVQFALSGSAVRAQVELPPDLWPCLGDEGQLLQVVDNLLINARQALDDSGTVRLSGANLPEDAGRPPLLAPGRYVRLHVEDDGPGVAEEHLHRVFEPFFTTKAQGTGLGLAVVWSIVKRHSGHVAIERGPAGGARVVVWLPAAPRGSSPSSPAPAAPSPKHAPRWTGRVLVMDDEPLVLDLVRAMLGGFGFDVDAVTDGAGALAAVAAREQVGERYVLGVIDLTNQKGLSGAELAGRVRGFPLIAMSGYSDGGAMLAPREYGFAASLAKPFLTADLARVVAQVLDPE